MRFGFVLKSSLDLESATYAQLVEVFHNTFQLTDDVSRKCVKFFIAMANDAGIKISPFITKRTRSARTNTGTKVSIQKNGNKDKSEFNSSTRRGRNSRYLFLAWYAFVQIP